MPAVPYGISSRATYGRSMSPGVIGSTVLPHVYAAKSAPGSSSTRVESPCASRYFVACVQYDGHVLGPLEVLAVERAVEERGHVHDDEHDHDADQRRADQRVAAPAQRPDARR